MARVNAVSDGQPLTYELLNQIITEINEIKQTPDDIGQNVEVYGPDIGMSDQDTVKIVSDVYEFALTNNDITKNIDVKFRKGGNFSKNNVVVVASLVDKNFGKKDGAAQMANITITNVTKTGFEARIQTLKGIKGTSNLEVHYIAIGAGPKSSA